MLMQKDARPASQDKPAPDQKQPRFLDQEPPRRVPIGRQHTDDIRVGEAEPCM